MYAILTMTEYGPIELVYPVDGVGNDGFVRQVTIDMFT